MQQHGRKTMDVYHIVDDNGNTFVQQTRLANNRNSTAVSKSKASYMYRKYNNGKKK